jgi:hypothetical protein
MMEFLETQPYLVMSLLLLLICAVGLATFRIQRRPIVLAGLLSMPFCIYEIVFIPEYWSPVQLGGRLIGLADFLFSFSTGGIAWMCATFCLKENVRFSCRPRLFFKRFFGGSMLGVMLSLILWFLGFKIMIAVLLSMLIGFIVLSWRFRRLHNISLIGALGFAFSYFAVIKLMFLFSSTFPYYWNHNNLSGYGLWGVPLEEVLWALGFGAIWPRFIAYVFDADTVKNRGRP